MKTYEKIMAAFKEMARSQGFYAVRMEELATRAGLSKRTIYLHFKSKEDLVEQCIESFLSETNAQVNEIQKGQFDLEESTARIMESFLTNGPFLFNTQSINDLRVYYPQAWQQFETYRRELITTVLNKILAVTSKKWVLEMDQRVITQAILAIDRRFIMPEFALEMGISMEKVTSQFAKLIVNSYL